MKKIVITFAMISIILGMSLFLLLKPKQPVCYFPELPTALENLYVTTQYYLNERFNSEEFKKSWRNIDTTELDSLAISDKKNQLALQPLLTTQDFKDLLDIEVGFPYYDFYISYDTVVHGLKITATVNETVWEIKKGEQLWIVGDTIVGTSKGSLFSKKLKAYELGRDSRKYYKQLTNTPQQHL